MFEQPASSPRTDAGDVQQFGRTIAHLAALAVKGHGETVRLVPNQLNQVKYWRMVVEHDRFTLLSEHVNDFFALGNRSQRLVDDLKRGQRFGSGVQLTQSTVDQHQTRHRLLFFLQTFVSARHHLAHGSEVIDAVDAADNELAVIGFFHAAVFPDHHRSYSLRALNMRNIEALDAAGQFRHAQRVLQRFLNRFCVRLHHPEALVVRLFGVVARQVQQRALLTAQGDDNVNPCGAAALGRDLLG